MIVLALVVVTGSVMLAFSASGMRLIACNFAVNDTHEWARRSGQRFWLDLHNSATAFRLFNCSGPAGTVFTDIIARPTTDRDPWTNRFLSQPANGVRFRRVAGGPFRIISNVNDLTGNRMTFRLSGGFVPQVGDVVSVPLIDKELKVEQVVSASSTQCEVRFDKEINSKLPDTANNLALGTFYRRAAFSVFGRELRYHRNFSGAAAAEFTVVARNVASTVPFAVLHDALPDSDGLTLHVSLETGDAPRAALRFGATTTRLQAGVPPRVTPTILSSAD